MWWFIENIAVFIVIYPRMYITSFCNSSMCMSFCCREALVEMASSCKWSFSSDIFDFSACIMSNSFWIYMTIILFYYCAIICIMCHEVTLWKILSAISHVTGGERSSLNWDLNPRPLAYHASTLTTELLRPNILLDYHPVTYPSSLKNLSSNSISRVREMSEAYTRERS